MSTEPRSGFLHRWSRRKIEAREAASQPPEAAPAPQAEPSADTLQQQPGMPLAQDAAPPAEPKLPTLDDVRALTSDSDFSPFVARGVAPEVKNAALKKLFSDPHYNVMDGLDIYIDDYSKMEPLPESMLRKMAVSKAFGFFEEEARCAAGAMLDASGEPAGAATQPVAAVPERQPEADEGEAPDAQNEVACALPAPSEPAVNAAADTPAVGLPERDPIART